MRVLSAAAAAAILAAGIGAASMVSAAAPVISGVATSTTDTTATISWTTDATTTGQVMYGTTTSYGLTSSATASGTAHTVNLTGLDAGTTYHFMIEATDASSTVATTSDDTFMTLAASTTPVISGLSASSTGTSTVTVSWTTDVPATTQVAYGTTTSLGSTTTLDTTLSTSHSVNLTGLSASTTYHLEARSGNNAGTTTASTTVNTLAATSSVQLAVDGVSADDTSALANNSYSDGWQFTMRLTVPDDEDAFRIRFSDWAQGTTSSFAAAGNMRIFSAQSSNATSSSSALNIASNGFDGWLYLTGDTSTTTPGRQIDLVIQVKIPFGTASGSYTTFFTAQSWPDTATSTATST
jgi:hypothetical protein